MVSMDPSFEPLIIAPFISMTLMIYLNHSLVTILLTMISIEIFSEVFLTEEKPIEMVLEKPKVCSKMNTIFLKEDSEDLEKAMGDSHHLVWGE